MDAPTGGGLAPDRRVLLALSIVCFGNLLLEVVLTRIFSATMYYHFTFLAIAMALFGMGSSGVYVYIKSDRYTPERARDDLATNARRFGAATIFALMYVLANPIDLGVGMGKAPTLARETVLKMVLLNGVTALPFFFAGMVVSLAVTHYRRHIDRVYFFDLVGAAVAALVAGLLLGWFGAPSLVLLLAVMAVAAGLLFRRPTRLAQWIPLGLVLALLALNLVWPVIAVGSGKGVRNDRLVFEKWNVFSRVTVEKLKSGKLDITIDASAKTRIANRYHVRQGHQANLVSALAYSLHPRGANRVLIIGPGGGPDVVNALSSGARHVTGVEINPIIVNDVMNGKFLQDNGALYRDPRVRIVVDEGRSFIRRSSERYNVIQATLVDTWAATASGAFALTENTLYTVEAFEDYYRHLSNDGVLSMTRWLNGPEVPRLLLLAAAGLTKLGVDPTQARKHIILAKKGPRGTMLAKRTPFTEAELSRIEAAAKAGKFEIIVSPKTSGRHPYELLLDSGPYSDYVNSQPNDLSPPTDDRPFFFYFNKPSDLFRFHLNDRKLMNPAMWILVAFGAAILALTVVFILLPLAVHRRDALRGGGRHGVARRLLALAYFATIGLGFIIVEIALMQKLGLFLGHPSYGLIIVLFSILVATAAGARLTGKIADGSRVQFGLAAALGIAALTLLYSAVLDDLLRDWITMVLPLRMVVAGLVVALAGGMMGLMLPLGIRLISDRDAEIIPWAWGINGATSVIGTVLATMIAIHYGFNATLRVGSAMYVIAGGGMVLMGRFVGRASD